MAASVPRWLPDGKSLILARYPQGVASTRAEDYSVVQFDLKTRIVSTLAGSTGMWAPLWVGVVQGRSGACFPAEAFQSLWVLG
jgi:hypothetical protein